MNSIKSEPLFKKGDKCVYICKIGGVPSILDDNMVIKEEPFWYDYENHPKGGYWCYPIIGKANECPEDFLKLQS